MESDFPKSGQVFEYHYLWRWQAMNAETEGRKKRPCCMALVTRNVASQHVMFIAPITSKMPDADRKAVLIPETEAHRAKLQTDTPLWVIVDEVNADILETSYTLEDRVFRGQFGPAFTNVILHEIQLVRKKGKLKLSVRT